MSETPSREASRDHAISVAAMSSERIDSDENVWTRRLVLFLRIMAVIAVVEGLYHWAQVTGFIGGEDDGFENQPMPWQTATVYFAVIELVADAGLSATATNEAGDVVDQILGVPSTRGATRVGDGPLTGPAVRLLSARGPTVAIAAGDS